MATKKAAKKSSAQSAADSSVGLPVLPARGYVASEDIADAEQEAGSELDSALSKLVMSSPVDARFILRRLMKETSGRYEFHGRFVRDDMTEENIAERFGGGRWWVQQMRVTPNGGSVVASQCRFDIPGPYRPPMGPLPGVMPTPVAAGEAPVAASGAAPVRADMSMREQLDMAMATRVIDMMRDANRSAFDWTPILVALGPGIVELVRTIVTRKPAGPDPAMVALLERIDASLNRQAHAPGPATAGVADIVKSLRGLKEVQHLLTGDAPAGEGDMWQKIPGILEGLIGAARGAPREALPSAPASDPTWPDWHRVLHENGQQLTDFARRGLDPGLAAGMIVSYVPPDYLGVLESFLQRDTAAADIVTAIPAMQQFPQWTTDLLDALRAELHPDSEDK